MKRSTNTGFEGRIFLTPEEHQTYLRRMPVRYVSGKLAGREKVCEICLLPSSEEDPMQVAHKIPFSVGVADFMLTPEYLDSIDNLGYAHRKKCNKEMEMSREEISSRVQKLLSNKKQ